MGRRDPHSFWDDRQPRIVRFTWAVRVDFEARCLEGEVTHTLDRVASSGELLDLDTRGLTRSSVKVKRASA